MKTPEQDPRENIPKTRDPEKKTKAFSLRRGGKGRKAKRACSRKKGQTSSQKRKRQQNLQKKSKKFGEGEGRRQKPRSLTTPEKPSPLTKNTEPWNGSVSKGEKEDNQRQAHLLSGEFSLGRKGGRWGRMWCWDALFMVDVLLQSWKWNLGEKGGQTLYWDDVWGKRVMTNGHLGSFTLHLNSISFTPSPWNILSPIRLTRISWIFIWGKKENSFLTINLEKIILSFPLFLEKRPLFSSQDPLSLGYSLSGLALVFSSLRSLVIPFSYLLVNGNLLFQVTFPLLPLSFSLQHFFPEKKRVYSLFSGQKKEARGQGSFSFFHSSQKRCDSSSSLIPLDTGTFCHLLCRIPHLSFHLWHSHSKLKPLFPLPN